MKKVFLTVLAVALVAVTAVQAQKVNKSALVSKIEKSDADIADAKKGAKAATWINRGKAFYEAAIEPTKNLFVNMDARQRSLRGLGLSLVHGIYQGRQDRDLEPDAVGD